MCNYEKYGNSASVVRALNDILQGRSEHTVDELIAGVDTICGGWKDFDEDRAILHQRIKDFQHQKGLLSQKYTKTSDCQYQYEMHNGKKVVDQQLYDRAAQNGFPAGFFRDSFFHRVTFYCLPDGQDCTTSLFDLCTFAVCRINNMVTFQGSSFYGCEFHSCAIDSASFLGTTIAHTRFHDSSLKGISFQEVYMKSCNVIDCELERINFLCATLDGCSFGRVNAKIIRHLDTAKITQSGATSEEVKHNREAILAALRPQQGERRETPGKGRGAR